MSDIVQEDCLFLKCSVVSLLILLQTIFIVSLSVFVEQLQCEIKHEDFEVDNPGVADKNLVELRVVFKIRHQH